MKKLLTILLTLVMAATLINLNNSHTKAENIDTVTSIYLTKNSTSGEYYLAKDSQTGEDYDSSHTKYTVTKTSDDTITLTLKNGFKLNFTGHAGIICDDVKTYGIDNVIVNIEGNPSITYVEDQETYSNESYTSAIVFNDENDSNTNLILAGTGKLTINVLTGATYVRGVEGRNIIKNGSSTVEINVNKSSQANQMDAYYVQCIIARNGRFEMNDGHIICNNYIDVEVAVAAIYTSDANGAIYINGGTIDIYGEGSCLAQTPSMSNVNVGMLSKNEIVFAGGTTNVHLKAKTFPLVVGATAETGNISFVGGTLNTKIEYEGAIGQRLLSSVASYKGIYGDYIDTAKSSVSKDDIKSRSIDIPGQGTVTVYAFGKEIQSVVVPMTDVKVVSKTPGKSIELKDHYPVLATQKNTPTSLVIKDLLHNGIEHKTVSTTSGTISTNLNYDNTTFEATLSVYGTAGETTIRVWPKGYPQSYIDIYVLIEDNINVHEVYSYTQGSNTPGVVVLNDAYNNFMDASGPKDGNYVKFDGKLLTYNTDYKTKDGCVFIILEPSLLSKYSPGEYIVTVKDGVNEKNTTYTIVRAPSPDPSEPVVKDESCEKVIGPTWHWNNTKGICEDVGVVGTATR